MKVLILLSIIFLSGCEKPCEDYVVKTVYSCVRGRYQPTCAIRTTTHLRENVSKLVAPGDEIRKVTNSIHSFWELGTCKSR